MCANHSAVGAGSGLASATGTCTGIDMTSQSSRPASLRDGPHLDPGFRQQLLDPLPALGVQHLVAEQLLEPMRPDPARPPLADPDRLGDRLDDLGRVFLFRHAEFPPSLHGCRARSDPSPELTGVASVLMNIRRHRGGDGTQKSQIGRRLR